jgi:hypothetical protein
MTKKTIVLCQLQLAKTHVHPCLDFSISMSKIILEVVDEEVEVLVAEVEVLDVDVTTLLPTLEASLEASLEVFFLEENKCINCFGIDVSNKHIF